VYDHPAGTATHPVLEPMVSIKGTLETFNLCELLQMLAFNQKEGTLVLDSEQGPRTLYLDKGDVTFLEQDPHLTQSIVRMAKRHQVGPEARIDEAVYRAKDAGRGILSVLEGMGLLDSDTAARWYRDAAVEQLFEGQLTSVAGFEFVEGRAIAPDGTEGRPIRPGLPVEGMLLDVARMLDHWNTVVEVVPTPHEIYEGTGIGVNLDEEAEIDEELAELVIPRIDGFRSLDQIAVACHTTLYAAMQIACVLYQGGGIRSVPTASLVARAEDLLARGEPAGALPLLQRSLERGDAPLEARLRLADAYEASELPEEAAVALDTYAALSGDDDAPAVFEALTRALRLREGDLSTAARVCDFYLRRRPWLQEYRELATAALRDLIHGATTSGRPMDAAARLEGFIEIGDAPKEDRLLLADLLASGGESQRAAAVLFEHCQDLLAEDRRIPARQALRRVLDYDNGHADARRLLLEMDGARQKTNHHARVIGIVLALLLVAGGAGVAWFGYQESASTEVGEAQERARMAAQQAESKARELVRAFKKRAEAAAVSADEDHSLKAAADTLRHAVREVMGSTKEVMSLYLQEIERHTATGKDGAHRTEHEGLLRRRQIVSGEVDTLLAGYVAEAEEALAAGQKAHAQGEFDEARRSLRRSRNLAFEATTTYRNAVQKLEIVDEYHALVEVVAADMTRATKAREFENAFAIGVKGLRDLLDSDLTRKLAFPLRVTSTPPGAEVWMGKTDTGARAPCDITYSPFHEEPILTLRIPGRKSVSTRLPSYKQIQRGTAPRAGWKPEVGGTLRPGVRWVAKEPRGRFTCLWNSRDVPVLVGRRGRTVYSVDRHDGSTFAGSHLDAGIDAIRLGGRLADGVEWTVHGQRTLSVRPSEGNPWVVQSVGRIDHPPIAIDGNLILVDALGTVYAFGVESGQQRWRTELSGAPSHRPYASQLGILLATTMGAAYKLDPERGNAVPLAPAVRGSAMALPLGDGAIVLGGGKDGYRIVSADGTVRTVGDAMPRFDRAPWADRDGAAWFAPGGGIRFVSPSGGPPRELTGLGQDVEHIGGGDGLLYGTTSGGTLRCVSLTKPDQMIFEAPLGGRATTDPLPLGKAVFILVDGALVAVEI